MDGSSLHQSSTARYSEPHPATPLRSVSDVEEVVVHEVRVETETLQALRKAKHIKGHEGSEPFRAAAYRPHVEDASGCSSCSTPTQELKLLVLDRKRKED